MLVLLAATHSFAAVTFDASSSAQEFSDAPSISWSHTATGSNRYVRVCFAWASLRNNTASATYGGVSMSSVGSTSNINYGSTVIGKAQIFELIAPATGSQTVAVTFSDTGNFGAAGSVSYTSVNQSVASGTAVTDTGNANQGTSLAVSTNSGDMISDCFGADVTNLPVTAGQTQRFRGSAVAGSYYGASQDATGSGSININWTWPDTTAYVHVGANILQVSGTTATPRRRVNQQN